MGVINRGILGGFRGKVANIVGSSWKGIDTMRSLPTSVANPRTAAQVAQRTKLTGVVALAKLILLSIIKPAWDRFAVQMSGYNDFVKANIGEFSSLGVATYANLKMAIGKLVGLLDFSQTLGSFGAGTTLAWTDNSGTGNALSTDELYFVIINEDNGNVAAGAAGVDRAEEEYLAAYPEGSETGDVVHVYAFFRSADGTRVSNSSYLTGTIPGI